MKKLFLTGITLYLSFITSVYAGVIISCELPQGITQMIQKQQALLPDMIQNLNSSRGTAYAFQEAHFYPHLSLAYVSPDELSLHQVQKKYPELVTDLQKIAQQNAVLDITPHFAQAKVKYWPGICAVNCGGTKKKNYFYVVLKLAENPALVCLAAQLHELLKEKYGIVQKFPFSAHVTVGILCQKSDQLPDSADLKMLAADLKAELEKGLPQEKMRFDTFRLQCHDHLEMVFHLSGGMLKK